MDNYFTLQTELGAIRILPTEASHIYVTGLGADSAQLTVNRVEYYVSGHLYLWADGKFYFGREGDRTSQIHEPYMRKVGVANYNDQHPSQAALRKAREVLTKVVNEWAYANPKAMAEAELERRRTLLTKAREEEEKAAVGYEEAKEKSNNAAIAVEVQVKVVSHYHFADESNYPAELRKKG